MIKSKLLYTDLTTESITPDNGSTFTEAELTSIAGPVRITAPVTDDGSGSPTFSIDEDDGEELPINDYMLLADANKLGEENMLAAALAGEHEFFGTVLLAHKSHL